MTYEYEGVYEMDGIYEIVVRTLPAGMPRPRTRHVKTKDGREFSVVYNVKNSPAAQFKSDIRRAVQDANIPMIEGPVSVSWTAYFPRPKNLCRKKDPEGVMPHFKKPDRDNIDKAVLDALAGVVLKNDRQVFSGTLIKFYCAKNPHHVGPLFNNPGIVIKIRVWGR